MLYSKFTELETFEYIN